MGTNMIGPTSRSTFLLLALGCSGCDALKAVVNHDRESMIRSSSNSTTIAEAPRSSTPLAAGDSNRPATTTDPWGDGYDFNDRVAGVSGGSNSTYGSSSPATPGYPSPSYKPINPADLPQPNMPPPGTPGYSSPPSYPSGPGYSGDPGYPTTPGYPTAPGYPTTPGYPGLPNIPTPPGLPGLPSRPGLPDMRNIPDPSKLISSIDSNLTDFSGNWVVIRWISDGKEQSPADKDRILCFSTGSWSPLLSPSKRVNFTLKPEYEPKRIDIEDADRNLHLGIYKIENNQLFICYNNRSLRRPTSFEPEEDTDLVQMELVLMSEEDSP